MRQYKYAKIPLQGATALGLCGIRKKTASGDYIINESDVSVYGEVGDSFEDKIERLGGTVLTNQQAKQELQNINGHE